MQKRNATDTLNHALFLSLSLALVAVLIVTPGCKNNRGSFCVSTSDCPDGEICLPEWSACVPVVLPDAAVIAYEPFEPPDSTWTPEPTKPVDNNPVCNHACTSSQARCSPSGWISYCTQDTQTKCRVWSPAAPCPNQKTCANGTCDAGQTCKDACIENERRCVEGKQQSCKRQADGCTTWGPLLSCPSGQICKGDKCQFGCSNQCTEGAKQCQGNAVVHCVKQPTDGCTMWQNAQTCTSQQSCKVENNVPLCKDNTTSGGANCGMDTMENEVFVLVNKERTNRGLSPYQCNDKLVLAARSWSQEQCKSGRISHDNMSQRVKATGLPLYGAGENVAAGQRSAASVMNSWMNSSGHKANILRSSFTHIGVGRAVCSDRYGMYWTQIFGTMR